MRARLIPRPESSGSPPNSGAMTSDLDIGSKPCASDVDCASGSVSLDETDMGNRLGSNCFHAFVIASDIVRSKEQALARSQWFVGDDEMHFVDQSRP